MDNIEIIKLKHQARENGCLVFVSENQDRLMATDGTGVMIATAEGKIRIPITELEKLKIEVDNITQKCAETFAKLKLTDKNKIALGHGISYGKLQEIIAKIRGGL